MRAATPLPRQVRGKGRRSKYGNVRATIEGVGKFDSTGEAWRHVAQADRERRGEITGLRRQPRYPLRVAGILIATYVADWEYTEQGQLVAEDWKGAVTREFRMKSKLFQALYPGVTLRVTGPASAKRGRRRPT